jgi:hypothetical protein
LFFSFLFGPSPLTKVGLGHVPLLQFCSSEVHNEQNKSPSQKDKKSRREYRQEVAQLFGLIETLSLTCEKRMTLQAMFPACQATVIFHTMSVRTLMTPTLKSVYIR